jgi:hypothetical protein
VLLSVRIALTETAAAAGPGHLQPPRFPVTGPEPQPRGSLS